MNETLQNGDVSSGIGLLNSHTLPKDKKSSKLNEINMTFENGDINGDYFYMNSFNGSDIKNHNYINYTNKRDENSTNRYLRGNNGLPDCVDIDDILPASKLKKYVNMKYNNEHNNLQRHGNVSTPNNS